MDSNKYKYFFKCTQCGDKAFQFIRCPKRGDIMDRHLVTHQVNPGEPILCLLCGTPFAESEFKDQNLIIEPGEKKYHILIAVPTMGNINVLTTSQLVGMARKKGWPKEFRENSEVAFYFTHAVAPVDRARNSIVEYFLAQQKDSKGNDLPNFTHIFFLDADTVPPANVLPLLLSHEKDIISGITPIPKRDKKQELWYTVDNCWESLDRDVEGKIIRSNYVERGTGLKKIVRCGASCLLIKREVFDKLSKPYFKYLFNEDMTTEVMGEDVNFCHKAQDVGFEIFCDTSVICNHVKDMVL